MSRSKIDQWRDRSGRSLAWLCAQNIESLKAVGFDQVQVDDAVKLLKSLGRKIPGMPEPEPRPTENTMTIARRLQQGHAKKENPHE